MASDELLKSKFISRILREEAKDIDTAQRAEMSSKGFKSRELWNKRRINSTDNKLIYIHLAKHRFIDMSVRNTQKGRINKIAHPIHNRILFGHSISMVHRMSFEYTERMQEMMMYEILTEKLNKKL